MAWEIWSDTDSNRSYGQMGFFCNTTDVSFGPVFMTDSFFDKGEFYEMWEKAGFKDPRNKYVTNSDISKQTRHILNLMDYDEKIVSTMKISRIDGINAPSLFYEGVSKSSFDVLGFSPFMTEIEALSEDDFDIVVDLIEECNEDMKHLILTKPNEERGNTWRKGFVKGKKGFRVSMEWEVLDGY